MTLVIEALPSTLETFSLSIEGRATQWDHSVFVRCGTAAHGSVRGYLASVNSRMNMGQLMLAEHVWEPFNSQRPL